MSDDARLARLSGELDAARARIDALKNGKKTPLPSRVAAHVSRRGSLILNAALAGATFAVAAGRLSLQRQHEVREWIERSFAVSETGRRAADALFFARLDLDTAPEGKNPRLFSHALSPPSSH